MSERVPLPDRAAGESGGEPRARRTFLVECYLPSIARDDVTAAAARAGAAAKRVGDGSGRHVAYLGAMLVAQDEVVFHAFSAEDVEVVDAACRQAAIPFERIVESETVPGGESFSAEQLLQGLEPGAPADG